MNRYFRIGTAWHTQISLHISWLWLIPFAIFALVIFDIEPLFEATVALSLLLGSVLTATLAQIWVAQHHGLKWQHVVIFPLGGVVTRTFRSRPRHEAHIALAALAVYGVLSVAFGLLWYVLPVGALGIEMELVAIANLALFVFSIFLRLSPNHDNLLHAIMTATTSQPWPTIVLTVINTIALVTFAISGLLLILLRAGWIGLAGWFLSAGMLSQLATMAERHGEYRDDLLQSPLAAGSPLAASSRNAAKTHKSADAS